MALYFLTSSVNLLQMSELKIKELPIGELIPHAQNSRTHSHEQVSQIAASIKGFGFTNPILIGDNNDIIAGHGRVLAASLMKMETVPCIKLGHLTENQKRAYMIADNKIALNAGWDEELLGLELTDLREVDFDLGLIGFDGAEIELILNPPEQNPESSTKEIDSDDFVMECTCPKCGFEFDPK